MGVGGAEVVGGAGMGCVVDQVGEGCDGASGLVVGGGGGIIVGGSFVLVRGPAIDISECLFVQIQDHRRWMKTVPLHTPFPTPSSSYIGGITTQLGNSHMIFLTVRHERPVQHFVKDSIPAIVRSVILW